jgi:hypothetical protein
VYPINRETMTPGNPRYVAMWWSAGQSYVLDSNDGTELSCAQAKALTESQRSETRANVPSSPRYLRISSNLSDPVLVDLKTLSELDRAQATAVEQESWRRMSEIDQEFGRLVCSVGSLLFPLEICP